MINKGISAYETKRERDRDRETEEMITTQGYRFKHDWAFFANLSLMANTATLNTSNKNTINYAGRNDFKTKRIPISV